MAKFTSIVLNTLYDEYKLAEVLGEGGAGRVFAATSADGSQVAIKVLSVGASADTRKRFKNETAFLARNDHSNIVRVIDHGVATDKSLSGPFYVMRQYSGNLRMAVRGRNSAPELLGLFSQILDGVEAAHLGGTIHRDLKPENILFSQSDKRLAVADFGVARFSVDQLATLVATAPSKRLANFQYAAPEQRTPNAQIEVTADIYALGLIFNEMFTGVVPHGQGYKTVADVFPEYAFLDPIIVKMLLQDPARRFPSINSLKVEIQKYQAEAVSLQKLDALRKAVVPAAAITDPLAQEPPKVANVSWDNGRLSILLDRQISPGWISAFQNMGSFTSIANARPGAFKWTDRTASVPADESYAQQVIDIFKEWLPNATRTYHAQLENAARSAERQRQEQLEIERQMEERKLRVNRTLTF